MAKHIMLPDNSQSVLEYISLKTSKTRHATLIDPANQTPNEASRMAEAAIEAGTNLIMIGGSTETPHNVVEETVDAIQEIFELRCWSATQNIEANEEMWKTPIVLFPGGSRALASKADAITFMTLMNSNSRKYLMDEQRLGAQYILKNNIEPIPTGYLIYSPGGKAGQVGEALLIQKEDLESTIQYASAANCFNFQILYLEAGSGAKTPISTEHISLAREHFQNTLFVGGGIRTTNQIKQASKSGADWVVTGTVIESYSNLDELKVKLQELINAL